jgi:hypothetical protein
MTTSLSKEETMLTAKSAKLTLVLDPAEVATLVAPEGKQFKLLVSYQGGIVDVPLSGKGVRKTIALVKELGVENVAVIVQGKLRLGSPLSLEEAGILAQPRAKKPEAPAADQAQAA